MLLLQTDEHTLLLFRDRDKRPMAGSSGVLTIGYEQLQDVSGAVSRAGAFAPRPGGQGYGASERQLLAK